MGENINHTKNKNEVTICCKYMSGQQVSPLTSQGLYRLTLLRLSVCLRFQVCLKVYLRYS